MNDVFFFFLCLVLLSQKQLFSWTSRVKLSRFLEVTNQMLNVRCRIRSNKFVSSILIYFLFHNHSFLSIDHVYY